MKPQKRKSPRPSGELKERVMEQARFLRRSCVAFDAGDAAEARRIAVSLRLLLHDGGSSRSLLGQLGKGFRWRFSDSASRFVPENRLPHHGLVLIKLGADAGAQFVPRRDVAPAPDSETLLFTPFWSWWNAIVLSDGEGNVFTRRDLVHLVADQDGGAHVDPELDARYLAVSRQGSFGLKNGDGTPVTSDPVAPSLRQIAHEVLTTLEAAELVPTGDR
jgi:hypothetical protein